MHRQLREEPYFNPRAASNNMMNCFLCRLVELPKLEELPRCRYYFHCLCRPCAPQFLLLLCCCEWWSSSRKKRNAKKLQIVSKNLNFRFHYAATATAFNSSCLRLPQPLLPSLPHPAACHSAPAAFANGLTSPSAIVLSWFSAFSLFSHFDSRVFCTKIMSCFCLLTYHLPPHPPWTLTAAPDNRPERERERWARSLPMRRIRNVLQRIHFQLITRIN